MAPSVQDARCGRRGPTTMHLISLYTESAGERVARLCLHRRSLQHTQHRLRRDAPIRTCNSSGMPPAKWPALCTSLACYVEMHRSVRTYPHPTRCSAHTINLGRTTTSGTLPSASCCKRTGLSCCSSTYILGWRATVKGPAYILAWHATRELPSASCCKRAGLCCCIRCQTQPAFNRKNH